jgi:ribonuclease P protein subunit POP4
MTSAEISANLIGASEWMGLSARVAESTDKSRIGIFGRVVNETKNTITLETKRGEVVLPKPEVKIEFGSESQKTVVDLKQWCFRPEDRIKAWAKKRK